jgi:hypothetical protein
MSKPFLAASISALTLALALGAPNAAGQANQDTAKQDGSSQSQSDPSRLPAKKGEPDGNAQQIPSGSRKMDADAARKHPPTASMDSATPREKSPATKSGALKHPPTSQMDRAVPTQKSGSPSSDVTGSSSDASPSAAK